MRQPTSGRAAARAQQASGRHRICSFTLERATASFPGPAPLVDTSIFPVPVPNGGANASRFSPDPAPLERRETRFASFRDVMGLRARPDPIGWMELTSTCPDEVSDVYKTKMGSSTVHAEESRYRRHPECLPLGTRTANMEQHKHAERSEPELPAGSTGTRSSTSRPPI